LDGDSAALQTLQARTARRRNAPPFAIIRLWLSHRVANHRPAFLGTSGYALLDNISVLERYEATAQTLAATHDGSVVELHAYAADAEAHPRSAAGQRIRAQLLADMHRVYPEPATMNIVAEEYLLDDDCGLAD